VHILFLHVLIKLDDSITEVLNYVILQSSDICTFGTAYIKSPSQFTSLVLKFLGRLKKRGVPYCDKTFFKIYLYSEDHPDVETMPPVFILQK